MGKYLIQAFFWVLAVALETVGASNGHTLEIVSPRCEGLREPLGLVRSAPRFTWGLAGEEAQSRPKAEVRVLKDGAVVWAKTAPDLFSCVYDGAPLKPGEPYQWQVRLAGATDWCAPQRFSCAIRDWEGAQWVGEASHSVDWTDFSYQTKFILVKDAFGVYFRARSEREGYMWQVNTKLDPDGLLRPHVFQKDGGVRVLPAVKLAPFFPKGLDWTKEHALRVETRGTRIRTFLDGVEVHACTDATFAAGTIGVRTSAGEEALVAELAVTGADGRNLLFDRFRGHIMPAFHNPPLQGDRLHLQSRACLHPGILPKNAPRVRKTFTLRAQPIRRAIASACGFGFYELWLNGAKVDPTRVLAPGMTGTDRASLFDTYDVTAQLKAGAANTVGFWLAPGYSDDFSRYGWHWLKPKRAILHLAVTYADGTREVVVTDGSWETTQASEVTRASIYHGETIDANRIDAAWCTPGGAKAGWAAVTVWPMADAAGLRANDAPPVRISDPRRPVKIAETRPGVFTVDFGQNRAGFVEVRAKGAKGTKIRVHTSELLGKDGEIDPWTNAGVESTDEFVLAGTGAVETFRPRFTYHGFQFAEITGWPGRPTADDLVAWAVHADMEPAGSFACDDEGLNQYVNAANWSMRSNFVSYPTDCCMRGERTPCQMDSQAYEDAALLWFRAARYYEKWLDDVGSGRGNPDWTGDSVTLPWRLWRATGDRRVLEERYEGMKAQVDDDVRKWPSLICTTGFGDWCAPNDGTWKGYFNDVEIVNSSIFCEMCRIVGETATVLGKTADADRYRALHARAKAAFHAKFHHADTQTYGDGSQTTAALPLAFGIVPAADRAALAARLVKTIRDVDGGRVNAGIFGMRYLGDVLCDLGEADLFVRLMTQPEFPGFGFMFANGATTLWEQWTYKGGMNTHNHAMFSGALHSLMTGVAGIRAAEPGYAAVEIRPTFPKALSRLKAHHDTPRGRVEVSWRRGSDGAVELEVEVPPYTPATLVLPGRPARALKAGRQRIVVTPVMLEKVGEYPLAVNGASGIAWAGGERFYVVSDHDRAGQATMYALDVVFDSRTGAVVRQTVGAPVPLEGSRDAEGIAWDAATRCLWVSDETDASVRAFGPNGRPTGARVPVPEIQRAQMRPNLSLEALGVTEDARELWTCNEEALRCDGMTATQLAGTVVRLMRYTRGNPDGAWVPAGAWPYVTERAAPSVGPCRSGVSGVCPLGDGSALALEREVSAKTWGRCSIYRVTAAARAAATDVTGVAALTNAPWRAVAKGRALVSFEGGRPDTTIVYEGICLGPRLADGSRIVCLVSDGGEERTVFGVRVATAARLAVFRLTQVDGERG